MYEVEYKDGQKTSLTFNAIAENMYDRFDGKVNWHVIFQEIVDHRYNGTEVKEQNVFITMSTGTKCRNETTKGVELLVQCNYGSTTWTTLKDMKNSYIL